MRSEAFEFFYKQQNNAEKMEQLLSRAKIAKQTAGWLVVAVVLVCCRFSSEF